VDRFAIVHDETIVKAEANVRDVGRPTRRSAVPGSVNSFGVDL
jgi:hypothetical protein